MNIGNLKNIGANVGVKLKNAVGIQDGLIGHVAKARLVIGADLKKSPKMVVKYNPSSLNFSTRAGSFQQPVVGNASTQINQITIPSQTTLNVELIFDAVNNEDAFMMQKFNTISAGGVLSKATAFGKNLTKTGYSVQSDVEGLIGLLLNSNTRIVTFAWSDMIFKGELTSVSATYTMFNPIGNPIRAKVSLAIQQNDNKEESKYWDTAFDALFGEAIIDNVVNTNSKKDVLQNWINI